MLRIIISILRGGTYQRIFSSFIRGLIRLFSLLLVPSTYQCISSRYPSNSFPFITYRPVDISFGNRCFQALKRQVMSSMSIIHLSAFSAINGLFPKYFVPTMQKRIMCLRPNSILTVASTVPFLRTAITRCRHTIFIYQVGILNKIISNVYRRVSIITPFLCINGILCMSFCDSVPIFLPFTNGHFRTSVRGISLRRSTMIRTIFRLTFRVLFRPTNGTFPIFEGSRFRVVIRVSILRLFQARSTHVTYVARCTNLNVMLPISSRNNLLCFIRLIIFLFRFRFTLTTFYSITMLTRSRTIMQMRSTFGMVNDIARYRFMVVSQACLLHRCLLRLQVCLMMDKQQCRLRRVLTRRLFFLRRPGICVMRYSIRTGTIPIRGRRNVQHRLRRSLNIFDLFRGIFRSCDVDFVPF